MTSDYKLNKLLQDTPGYQGVYLYNQLDQALPLTNGFIVVNYVTTNEASQGKVGHFVVIDNRRDLIKGNGETIGPYYFDGYGLVPDEAREYMGLDNPHYISKFLDKITKHHVPHNTHDFQSVQPWDSLCGVYSIVYGKNPNFKTNYMLSPERTATDRQIQNIAQRLGVVGDKPLSYRNAEEAIRTLSGSRSFDI